MEKYLYAWFDFMFATQFLGDWTLHSLKLYHNKRHNFWLFQTSWIGKNFLNKWQFLVHIFGTRSVHDFHWNNSTYSIPISIWNEHVGLFSSKAEWSRISWWEIGKEKFDKLNFLAETDPRTSTRGVVENLCQM